MCIKKTEEHAVDETPKPVICRNWLLDIDGREYCRGNWKRVICSGIRTHCEYPDYFIAIKEVR